MRRFRVKTHQRLSFMKNQSFKLTTNPYSIQKVIAWTAYEWNCKYWAMEDQERKQFFENIGLRITSTTTKPDVSRGKIFVITKFAHSIADVGGLKSASKGNFMLIFPVFETWLREDRLFFVVREGK